MTLGERYPCVESSDGVCGIHHPVGLNDLDFIIQKAFDMSLKVVENLLNIRLVFKQINPSEAHVASTKLT